MRNTFNDSFCRCFFNSDTITGIWYSTFYAYQIESSTDNKLNTWTAWDIPYKPLLPDGTFGFYDSLDITVINYHLEKMSEAKIDFIIMDQTNHIDVDEGYINARSLGMAAEIKKYNDDASHRPVRYCSAVGAIQWESHADTIENEAKILWERYVNTDLGSEKYHYYYKGKPLLVVYGDGAQELWEAYTGDKIYGSKFTIRWADNNSTPGYWGWAFFGGPKYDKETMVVMPGWHNRAGNTPVDRNYGETYKKFWRKVLNAKKSPHILVINSFNEYAECTAIFPANTSGVTHEGDQWYNTNGAVDPFMYWNMTVDYIKKLKNKNRISRWFCWIISKNRGPWGP